MTPAEAQRSVTIDTVARTVWGEARGEGEEGMQACINVMQNRVRQQLRGFGLNLIAVCKKRGVNKKGETVYQYSCWGDGNREKLLAVTKADREFAIALHLATMAVDGTLPDLTGGADHYYARSMKQPPYWAPAMRVTARIGGHIFLRSHG